MNPERLLQHFDRIAEAPDAIPRLRRFILDLAVRGKLVEQDSNDEPAAELLKRIAAEKARLMEEGKIRKPDPLPIVDESVAPFELPRSWVWTRIGEVFDYDAGKKREPRELVSDRWLLELEDIEKDTSVILTRLTVAERDSRSTKSEFQVGDILYGKLRPYLNKVVVATESGYSTTEIVAIRPFIPLCSNYCCLAFRRPDFVDYLNRTGQGTKMPRLRTQDALIAVFPLPPLAEQHRIVAKVDELMALCDQLEATKTEREQSRDRLVAASLHRLHQPADAEEANAPEAFRDHARFYFNHLPRLTTRPEHIKQLRQTILTLAVCGKLSPQDPKDEPVGELLNRVAAERRELIAKGRLKPPKSCAAVDADPLSQPIPATWKWMRLADLISFGPQNGISPKPTNNTESPKALTLTATTSGAFDASYYKHVDLREVDCQNYWLSAGDVLFQRGNTREYVGIAAVFDGPEKSFVFPDLMIRVRFAESLSLRFIHTTLISPLLRKYFSVEATGASSSMPKISQGVLLNAPIPLPPLAEQHRIVAKVDELMALCDQLEAQLTTTEADSRRLLEAVLHEALAPTLEEAA